VTTNRGGEMRKHPIYLVKEGNNTPGRASKGKRKGKFEKKMGCIPAHAPKGEGYALDCLRCKEKRTPGRPTWPEKKGGTFNVKKEGTTYNGVVAGGNIEDTKSTPFGAGGKKNPRGGKKGEMRAACAHTGKPRERRR